MPTLTDIDSFQHQVLRIGGPWYTITDGSTIPCHDGVSLLFDETQPRTADHVCSLKYTGNTTTAVQLRRLFTGGQICVASFYFRLVTAPSAQVIMFRFINSSNGVIRINTTGAINALVQGGTSSDSANTYADGNWHRIDAKYDCSTTTGRLDVTIDGTDVLTQATGTVVIASVTAWEIGTNAAQAAAFDVWISDMVLSNTAGDYPIGGHICKLTRIAATGTHSQGAGAFTDHLGATTDAALLAAVDEDWNGTTPELSQTGEDHIRQTANDATGYVEYSLQTITEPGGIWAVELITLMAALDSATACNCETRLVHSGTTYATTGLVDPSVNLAYYAGYRIINSAIPGADTWSDTELNAARVRFGFSTDAAPDAIWNAGAVEYATPWTAPAAPTFHHADRSIYPGPSDA